MAFRVLRPDEFDRITRPHEPEEPARHVAELTASTSATGRRGSTCLPEASSWFEAGTPLQSANHGDAERVVYAHGYPPESENAELLESAV